MATVTASPQVTQKTGLRSNPWLTVIVLTIVYTSAFLDRNVIALLVDPIRADLGLTDVQISLLLGLAFILFYMIANLPAGALVDRLDRRTLILVSGLCWSMSTVACGLATNFWQLLGARLALGCSEAFISPAAFALLRDRVPAEQRGRALSIFGMAPFLGSALSMMLGGALLRTAMSGRAEQVPVIGSLEAWQFVLVSIGILALFPVFLITIIRPDGKRQAGGEAQESIRQGLGRAFRHIGANRTAYAMLFGYMSCGSAIMLGGSAWGPTLLARTYDVPLDQIGLTSGPIVLLGGIVGLVFSGTMIDLLQKRGVKLNAFAAVMLILTAAAYLGVSYSADIWQAFIAYGCMCIFGGASYPVAVNILTRLTPSSAMGKISAIYLLVQAIFGSAAGPWGIAFLTEELFSGKMALANGMALFVCSVAIAGSLFASRMETRSVST